MAETNLQYMLKKLRKQREEVKTFRAYYEGDHPLIYSNKRLREVFAKSDVNFIQNWCAVVCDATLDRIALQGFDNPDAKANKTLDEYWAAENLARLARRVHKDAVITGRGFIMTDMVDGTLKVFHNSPEQVALDYEQDDQNKKRLGVKLFYDRAEDMTRLNLYYPAYVEKYALKGANASSDKFQLVDEIPTPYGEIPIIEFAAQPDLVNVIPLQDAINKTFSDMMVVGEFGAFPQRWMITNADISSLTASPQSIMQIPKSGKDEEDTEIGEFGVADLGMYLETIDKLTSSIAIISRTPKHYFIETGANISGEALTVMETPLVKKCNALKEAFGSGWLELSRLITRSKEEEGAAAEKPTVCVWDRSETEQISTQTQAMMMMVNMGIPLITVLKQNGWSESDIAQMKQDAEEEKLKNASVLDSAVQVALARLQQTNDPYNLNSLRQTQAERGQAE